jgi:hypothetical protein
VFASAWEDLASPDDRVCSEAKSFFTRADAGEPLSLRFLCKVFELDLDAVQSMARARIAARVENNEQRRKALWTTREFLATVNEELKEWLTAFTLRSLSQGVR